MGLGPSHIPKCRSSECQQRSNVTYILSTKFNEDLHERLEPWWISRTLYDNRTLYWSCESCFHKIGQQDQLLFTRNTNYVCKGK